MNNNLVSDETAKRLMIGGFIGFVAGIVLSLVIWQSLYDKVGECMATTNTCSNNSTVEQIGARLVSVLMYVSLAIIVTGVVMTIALSVKDKQRVVSTQGIPSDRPKTFKYLIIKTLAFVIAFFVGGSIASLMVMELVPALFPSKDTNEQGRIFAYLIIIFYPFAGTLAVYLTNTLIKKKLR